MIKALWNTSKTRSDYLPIMDTRYVLPQRCFHNHWKAMKISTQSVHILCRNRENLCSCFWTYFVFLWLLVGVLQCFLRNVWLLLKENVQLISFLCVAASGIFSMLFNERTAASEKILTSTSEWKKMCSFFLWILST